MGEIQYFFQFNRLIQQAFTLNFEILTFSSCVYFFLFFFVFVWKALVCVFWSINFVFYFVFTKFFVVYFHGTCIHHTSSNVIHFCTWDYVLVNELMWYSHTFILFFYFGFLFWWSFFFFCTVENPVVFFLCVFFSYCFVLCNQHLRIYRGEENGRIKKKWKKKRMGLILKVFFFLLYMFMNKKFFSKTTTTKNEKKKWIKLFV